MENVINAGLFKPKFDGASITRDKLSKLYREANTESEREKLLAYAEYLELNKRV